MRIIAHVDMDAFFAAVEERDNPRFTGKPIVIGADPMGGKGRGVVSTANYKAREYGIRSAMPISWAWRNAEEARAKGHLPAIFLEVNMEKYQATSERIMAILHRRANHIEQASVDEAYCDLSSAGSYEEAEAICRAIKKDIRAEEHLTASVGIGPNKLIAKIASDKEKPNGLVMVREENAEQFLDPLLIRKIPGIGPKTEARLHALGIRTIKDARQLSRKKLTTLMGKWGASLYENARGRDEAPLVETWIPKSIGEQSTLPRDSRDSQVIVPLLQELYQGVEQRFRESEFDEFRSIVLTVRFADFTTKNRSHTFANPTKDISLLTFHALILLMPFLDGRENPEQKPIRLLGIRIEKLS